MRFSVIAILFFVLSSHSPSLGQQDTLQDELSGVNSSSESKIDSLQKELDVLSQRVAESEGAISMREAYQDTITLFTILTILFGIGYPVLLYIIQVRPSQETMKEAKEMLRKLDDKFEDSFREHLAKSRDKMINAALDNYEEGKTSLMANSNATLQRYMDEGFNELQVIRIIRLLKSDISAPNKNLLASILSFHEDLNIEEYFVQLIEENPYDQKCQHGMMYFARFNKVDNLDVVAFLVLRSHLTLESCIKVITDISPDYALSLINFKGFVNRLRTESTSVKIYVKPLIDAGFRDEVHVSLLWKRFVEKD